MDTIIKEIREALQHEGTEKVRLSASRFFKESITTYGVKTPVVRQIGKLAYKKLTKATKAEVFMLCETLWRSGTMEECVIALEWAYARRKQFVPEDFELFERWIGQYVTNWATCDGFCNHTIGTMLEMYPQFLERLPVWAGSQNRWFRRASAVSLIVPGKKGLFLDTIFDISNLLMKDTDDLVQKGYGWALKVACQQHEPLVFHFVMEHKLQMPRTALRYAIEKMPADMRRQAMER